MKRQYSRRSDLTAEEQKNVRTALKFLRTRVGSWVTLAEVLRFGDTTLTNAVSGHSAVSVMIAFRTARFAKVGVDDVLTGRFPAPGTCPHCGHAPADTWDDAEVKP